MNTRGHSGERVRVLTNAFQIRQLPRYNYHHYDVIIQKNVRNRDTNTNEDKELKPGQRYIEIIDKMQEMHARHFTKRVSYDGLRNLYSLTELQGATKFDVRIPTEKGRESVFEVRLTHVRTIDTRVFDYLKSQRGAQGAAQQPIECTVAVGLLQVLVSQAPHIRNNFSLHAKSFYSDEVAAGMNLVRGVRAISGIFQSVRPVLNSFIVNVDTTTATFYQDGWLVDVAMRYFFGRNRADIRDLISRCDNAREFERLRRFLKNVAIRVKKEYGGGRKRYIRDLVVKAGDYRFEKGKENEVTSVAVHYRETYRKELSYPRLFGIVCDGDAVFPAEVCDVLPGQRYRKKLDPDQTSEFLKHSVKAPGPRLQAINKAVTGPLLSYRSSPFMLDAGMEIDTNPLEIDARQLPPPDVRYAQGNADVTRNPGAWNVVGKRLWQPAQIDRWAIVDFDTPTDGAAVTKFRDMLAGCMSALGLTFRFGGHSNIFQVGNQHNPEESLDSASAKMLKGISQEEWDKYKTGCLIVVILPAQALELRKKVKFWGDTYRGVSTQCVRSPKYKVGLNDQYCNNLALKINTKMSGVNWLPVSPDIMNMLADTMVVGCDVSHPGPKVDDRPSIASVVYSYNSTATRYTPLVDCQEPRLEIIERFVDMLTMAIRHWSGRRADKKIPKTILIYRDGVSEGEFWQVVEKEIKPIKNMLGNAMNLVFIVVGKRHHVRFFPHPNGPPQARDKKGNCLPGLVVDSGVVHSTLPDFYLQSHAGLIGTCRPSHYIVLHNDPGWPVDNLQKLSYHLCYFYSVATRAVSIPAPVYYADRACTRAAYQFNQASGLGDYEHDSNSGTTFKCDVEKWRAALMQGKGLEKMHFV